ncbi:dihydroxyacetone kinase subunit DhaL [Devriesea agamarum]|uniref:dihydroxyacetone kinase subunit DhaL n=1 Tax=Devriesea agamarum TaxID=472569 RepID=UPI000A0479D5|nr:dihydroxyacetone kinase subunit DhaL [Devriesea agamarum]
MTDTTKHTVGLHEVEAWLRRAADDIDAQASYLTELDAAIGDADHGANMARGFTAVRSLLDQHELSTPGELLKKVGMTLVSTIGGASGPLYGTFFLRAGTSAGSAESLDARAWGAALRAGVEGICQRGKAQAGEKTMLDAWLPALDAMEQQLTVAPDDLAGALESGAEAAASGRDATRNLAATKGRASYLGERSVGHIDPGSASTAILWSTAAETLAPATDAGADTTSPNGSDPEDGQ